MGGAVSSVVVDLPDCAVTIRRNARARRLTLRLGPGGEAVVTAPVFVPEPEIRRFVIRHSGWLDQARARAPRPTPVDDGVEVPVDGVPLRVEHRPGMSRGVRVCEGTLLVGGNAAAGPRIAAWLKMRARDRLSALAHGHAARLGRKIARITLRDTTSRWGSCSGRGALGFSWRLAMAPPDVQDYVALHEAAHLVEMNHSDRFWAVVERSMPDYQTHRDWLRREGRTLHAYRFDG